MSNSTADGYDLPLPEGTKVYAIVTYTILLPPGWERLMVTDLNDPVTRRYYMPGTVLEDGYSAVFDLEDGKQLVQHLRSCTRHPPRR